MPFRSLIQIDEVPKKIKTPKIEKRGCENCTLNRVHGVQKIMGTVTGRRILVFAQSPGPEENRKGVELIGPAGRWLWKELKRAGIRRSDVDVQNVVRCFPATSSQGSYGTYLKMRNPSAGEIKCCSIYNERALEKSSAKLILVLGKVAALSVLQTRSLPTAKTFWSEKLRARVFLADHPSFFLRGYGKGPRLRAFRQQLEALAADWTGKTSVESLSDDYGYLRKQDYHLIRTGKAARRAAADIRAHAAKKRRVSVDIENDDKAVTACGFCPRPGLSYVFDFSVPEVMNTGRQLLEDGAIRKAIHYGCSDVTELRRLHGIRVRGFDHDTNFSEYLRFSDYQSYGLDALAESRFAGFSGYKTIVADDMLEGRTDIPTHILKGGSGVKYKYIDNKHLFDIRKLKRDTLRLYNGADADICKRIEVDNKKHVSPALMKLYIDLSFVLRDMEPNGPEFDYEQHKMLESIYPMKERVLRKQLAELAGSKDFNPGSPVQVAHLLYGKLGLRFPGQGKPDTAKMTLLLLGQRGSKVPGLILEWRAVSKVKSTYLDSYVACARANGDRLRTRWWATGTRTGRLSSGGGKKGTLDHGMYVNLQNVKKDAQTQNMCVADREWRVAYKAVDEVMDRLGKPLRKWWRLCDAEDREARKEGRKPLYPKQTPECAAAVQKILGRLKVLLKGALSRLRTFLILDYGQVEVRTMAQMSGDKNLIRDCQEGDIHTRVGVTMTGWDAERIKNDEQTRTLTKNVHFGIMFGLSREGLYQFVLAMSPMDMRGRITEEQVFEAYDRYFARYSGVRRFIESQREFGRFHKYVTTLFGMRQTLDVREDDREDIGELVESGGEGKRGSYWGNQVINGPVQGTAHQLMICALVNLRRKAKEYLKLLGIPTMEVHDALYFNVRVADLVEAHAKAKYLLEQESLNTVAKDFPDIDWRVPIVVEAKAGIRLGTKVKVDGKTTPAQFLLDWYRVCHKQIKELDQELADVYAARLAQPA